MGSQNTSTYGNTQLLDYLTTLHFTVVVVVVYINTRKTTFDFNFDFYQSVGSARFWLPGSESELLKKKRDCKNFPIPEWFIKFQDKNKRKK